MAGKIGSTHAAGMARKGLTELAQYLPAFNNAGTQVTEDAAIWPNQTQGEIAQARGVYGLDAEQERTQQQAAQESANEQQVQGQAESNAQGTTEPEVAQQLARMKGQTRSRSRGR